MPKKKPATRKLKRKTDAEGARQGPPWFEESSPSPLSPALSIVRHGTSHGSHEPHSGFDQPAGLHQVLPQRVTAVAVAHLARFPFQVEGSLSFRPGDEAPGPLLE